MRITKDINDMLSPAQQETIFYHFAASVIFGIWQGSILAGLFMFAALAATIPSRN